jgi:hypothetical protein
LQQLGAEMRFKRGYLLADGRLADAERARDSGETAAVHHPNEQTHGVETIQTILRYIPKME